ncbi:polysaccharide biosynthesis tyrosine autokinase [Aliiglaciecola sp. 2_MG-2023]|uniref:GumC family protein n=1 Tax=unclassified Aliiglaciecola TaxID=2593648 RepID=UPI0026E1A4FC|nr:MULTISPECIES: polysaccharide biosynthesis tyrosine autokinase [unclassified Aliiglaciecola]MDO6712191.1 polysaccharide biosynthesis tyrosine autokinase [Aliiglaciecola sp. 2_MG-2023]MDO6753571.1 polysaccharide biosynthesis tyrosine autokinase [Aliiglaciecola sp. 1_MG-2023]
MTNDNLDSKILDSEKIDFEQIWHSINRYFWRIILLATLVTILVALIVISMTPAYKASTSLLIESDQAKVTSIEEVYGLDSSKKEYFETQYEILRSRYLAEKVTERLNLSAHPVFNGENNKGAVYDNLVDSVKQQMREWLPFLPQKEVDVLNPKQQENVYFETAVRNLMSNLSIMPVRKTQVVNILFVSEDKEMAAIIANTFADLYIETYLEAKLTMTAKATSWLNDSLQGLKSKLDVSEKKLSEFYETEQLVDIDGVVGLAAEELQQRSEQLLKAQNNLKTNQAIFTQINAKNVSMDELSSLPEVINHPSIQNVKREEVLANSKVSELTEVYGPKHPKMISAKAELASIQQSLNNQIRSLISGVSSEYRIAINKVNDLKNEVEIAKQEYRKLTSLENKRRALQREVDINQQLYNSFFTRLKETSELGGFETANARVLDAAKVPREPFKPKKSLIVGAAFAVSLMFGVILALVMDALNRGIRSVEDVERKLGQRMLGIIPWQPHKKSANLSLRHFFNKEHHTFSEAVRTLRTSLQLLNIDKPSKTILVTSSVPKEGKSTVSINLAFAIGQLSKVLLIDTDLRKPSLATQFDLPGFQPGVANLVAGTHSIEECIVTDEVSNVDVLCAGTIPPNPQEILASDKFKALIRSFEADYDHIILDTAPTQAVSDAIVVSNLCDSVIYVVRADSTSDKIINLGLSRFLQIGHRVDGVVLNQVDLKKAGKSGEYSGFYDAYGYTTYESGSKSV